MFDLYELFDSTIVTTMFGEFSPIAPMIILLIGSLIMPAVFFATKRRNAVAAVTVVVIAFSIFINTMMMVDGYQGEYAGVFV